MYDISLRNHKEREYWARELAWQFARQLNAPPDAVTVDFQDRQDSFGIEMRVRVGNFERLTMLDRQALYSYDARDYMRHMVDVIARQLQEALWGAVAPPKRPWVHPSKKVGTYKGIDFVAAPDTDAMQAQQMLAMQESALAIQQAMIQEFPPEPKTPAMAKADAAKQAREEAEAEAKASAPPEPELLDHIDLDPYGPDDTPPKGGVVEPRGDVIDLEPRACHKDSEA